MASPKAESNLGSSDPEAYEEVIFGDRSVCTWEVMQSRKQDKSISGCTIKVTIKTAEAQYRLEFWGWVKTVCHIPKCLSPSTVADSPGNTLPPPHTPVVLEQPKQEVKHL